MLLTFKIDLIVWKHEQGRKVECDCGRTFKIDLIVWKRRIF